MFWLFFIPKLFGILLLITVILAYIITKRWDDKFKEYLKEGCQHLDGWPILGKLSLILHIKDPKDFMNLFTDVANSLDPETKIGCLRILHKQYALVKDPAVLEIALQSHNTIERSAEYSVFRAVFIGLLVASGERWKKLRKVVNKSFTPDNIEKYFEVHREKSKVICRFLGKTDGFVDIQHPITRLLMDTIIKTHFGYDLNETEEDKYQFPETVNEMLEIAITHLFSQPYLYNDFLYWRSKWIKRILAIRHRVYRPIELAAEKRYPEWLKNKEMNGNIPKNSILLDHYFQLFDELNLKQCNRTYNKLTSDIIFAGTDTSTHTICTCLYYVALYSDIQDKLYQEIQEHWPDDTELTRPMLKNFTYLEMCINEALRLAMAPVVYRPASDDIFISEGCIIPKGSTVCGHLEGVHLNPKYYEYPDKFYPDHFLPETVAARPKCAFIPFAYGPRSCPGSVYAMQAMKSILAHIVKEFHVETNLPYEDVTIHLQMMKQFTQGYPIKFTRRKA